jgi:hypothetical protein
MYRMCIEAYFQQFWPNQYNVRDLSNTFKIMGKFCCYINSILS